MLVFVCIALRYIYKHSASSSNGKRNRAAVFHPQIPCFAVLLVFFGNKLPLNVWIRRLWFCRSSWLVTVRWPHLSRLPSRTFGGVAAAPLPMSAAAEGTAGARLSVTPSLSPQTKKKANVSRRQMWSRAAQHTEMRRTRWYNLTACGGRVDGGRRLVHRCGAEDVFRASEPANADADGRRQMGPDWARPRLEIAGCVNCLRSLSPLRDLGPIF